MDNNQNSAVFLSGSVTPYSYNKPGARKRVPNKIQPTAKPRSWALRIQVVSATVKLIQQNKTRFIPQKAVRNEGMVQKLGTQIVNSTCPPELFKNYFLFSLLSAAEFISHSKPDTANALKADFSVGSTAGVLAHFPVGLQADHHHL